MRSRCTVEIAQVRRSRFYGLRLGAEGGVTGRLGLRGNLDWRCFCIRWWLLMRSMRSRSSVRCNGGSSGKTSQVGTPRIDGLGLGVEPCVRSLLRRGAR